MNIFQLAPVNDKDDNYTREIVKRIVTESKSQHTRDKQRIQKYWDVYNNVFNDTEYEYMTKVEGDLTYPAKVRDIGSQLIRTRTNILESTQARRRFRFHSAVIDERSIKIKYEQRMKNILDAMEDHIDDNYAQIVSVINGVNEQMQDMEKQLQVQPENEEMAMQLMEMKKNMPVIRLEYEKMVRTLSRQQLNMEDIKSRITAARKYNEMEMVEELSNAFIRSKLAGDLRDHWDSGMQENIITGQPCFFVNYNTKTKKVDFRSLGIKNAFYSKSSSNKWTDECEWQSYFERLSVSQIASTYDMTETELNNLSQYDTGTPATMVSYNDGGAVFTGSETNSINNYGGIPVWHVWWLVPRKFWYKQSPNKYRDGAFFYHLVKDPKSHNIKKDDKLFSGLIFDRYSATLIGDNCIKEAGLDTFTYRSNDLPGMTLMPIVTRCFTNDGAIPYSIIERVEPLRELYNVIMYNLELSIVLAGVKGMIMDKSQKPDKMTVKEWMYYRKIGTMWIETVKKNRKIPASFNQFQSYDDTLSQSIGTTIELLNSIDGLMGMIMGIPNARIGQAVSEDPVHNVMINREQSSLITEVMFYDLDKTFARAMTQYANLCYRFEMDNGKVISYADENLQEVLFRIPPGTLGKSDFTINIQNNVQEDNKLDFIRNMIMAKMPVNALVPIMKADSLLQLEKRLQQIVEDERAAATNQQMSIDNNKAEKDGQLLQIKMELESKKLDLMMQVEQAKMYVEKAKADADMQQKQWQRAFEEKKLDTESNIKMLGISSENEIESAYLNEQARNNQVLEQLEMFRLKIDSMLEAMNLEVSRHGNQLKHDVDIKKVESTKNRAKNNIKD